METPEIHMMEKHLDSDSYCIYCNTNQQHPRRITYPCGYKPFRCEVCSYSTNTKGNLSIHMQSDKHMIKNIQEIQNNGGRAPAEFLYTCAVCDVFSTDSLQELADHLDRDRTKLRENEVSTQTGGTNICKLCSYKTNLKGHFQIHCKGNFHLQKLQLVNHIMEGGPANERKLHFMDVSNSVELRCNVCDFYTESIQKLQIHSANQEHEISAANLDRLRREERKFKSSENPSYNSNSGRHIDQAQKSSQTAAQDVTLPGVSDLKHNFNIPNYSISDSKPKFITLNENVDVDENYD